MQGRVQAGRRYAGHAVLRSILHGAGGVAGKVNHLVYVVVGDGLRFIFKLVCNSTVRLCIILNAMDKKEGCS